MTVACTNKCEFLLPFAIAAPSVELQLTPMIDCVFLLMIYFIWSSSFAIAEMSLPSRLSAAAGRKRQRQACGEPPPPEADFPNVVVRILWNGAAAIWTVNDTPVGFAG